MVDLLILQKLFIRFLSFKTNTPMDRFDHNFHLMSTRFNLPTIQRIHRYNDMILVWRILNGAIDKEDHQNVFVKRINKYNLRSSKTYFEINIIK